MPAADKHAVHYSSATVEWGTPLEMFDALNKLHHYTLDAAATAENALCAHYFTKKDDGLAQKWEGRVFVNPPYARKTKDGPGTDGWIEKGREAVAAGDAKLVTLLLPTRTSNHGFYDAVFSPIGGPSGSARSASHAHDFTFGELRWRTTLFGHNGVTEIIFERGRIKFVGAGKAGAPFPSVWVNFMSYDYYKKLTQQRGL